ncbi:biotin/lipoate A/B protein ligase family [Synechococcus sp. PCC 7335]|nr:biotin/lipoate A/B protein ligase family [Synechococcus sp. PCC 7335]
MNRAGAEHMAIDSWLLDQHVKGLQPSCLRFYTWRSPTISLGYHQHQFPDHWKHLRYKGQPVELVRRPTGGRAVLHQGELTYALVTSRCKGSRKETYRQLCQFLIEGWRELGVELSFGNAKRGYINNPNCFGTATSADLVMNDGYKLVGSAQVYREGCVLQHGSMRLRPDIKLYRDVFGEELGSPTLSEAYQKRNSPDDLERVSKTLAEAARACFDIDFDTQALTSAETESAITTHLLTYEQQSHQNSKAL